MSVESIFTILASLGVFETAKSIFIWYKNRVHERKKNLLEEQKDAIEVVALDNEKERAHIDWLENRIIERDQRVDKIFKSYLETNEKLIQTIKEKGDIELQLKEVTIKRCDIRKCPDREPPSSY